MPGKVLINVLVQWHAMGLQSLKLSDRTVRVMMDCPMTACLGLGMTSAIGWHLFYALIQVRR